ncbi:hypothetical protein [Neobacillus drentensis]|uniref:hypothetical protein n=1 Tax=Neobacillus drentensis TaxID=220684 RepID=UPI002858C075|nr:hypothetical protein [Neobacillus drentensis]MDR7238154.1 hypothetical protein [Neobacillus drentensis]
MTIRIEIEYKGLSFEPEEDIYEFYDTTIDIINNDCSFFENFQPITKNSELAKYIHHDDWEGNAFTYHHVNANFPLFSMILDMNLGLRQIRPNEVFVLTHDAYQSELVLKRQEEDIHLFYHLKYKGLWYDGSQMVFSRKIPEKSCFVVSANEFINAIDDCTRQIQEFLSINHSQLMKEQLVQRSFGLDSYFNNIYGNKQKTYMISELDDLEMKAFEDFSIDKMKELF